MSAPPGYLVHRGIAWAIILFASAAGFALGAMVAVLILLILT